jgi:hypothetical protein
MHGVWPYSIKVETYMAVSPEISFHAAQCRLIVQNSVHGDQAELDPIHDDSVAVFFFSGKERESKHIYIARWGLVVGWISHQCLGLA